MPLEIKRKFYYAQAPRKTSTVLDVAQGYVQDTGGWEACLERVDSEYFLRLTAGEGLFRTSWVVPISAESWQDLWPRTEGYRVLKTYESFALNGKDLLVERFVEPRQGLVIASVDFPSQQEARSWKVPNNFGPELTYDPRFQSKALADKKNAVPLTPLGANDPWAYGVLPLVQRNKTSQVVLVLTRNQERWIFPKGQPEVDKPPSKVALQEGREEAGIEGRIVGNPIVLPYSRSVGTTNLLLFPVRVTRLANTWLEAAQRERRVLSLAEASGMDEPIRWGAHCLQELYADV